MKRYNNINDEIKAIDSNELIQYTEDVFSKHQTFFSAELCYYTDISALINGIICDEGVCLWASRWSCLNDKQEILNGINELKTYVAHDYFSEGLLEISKLLHILSFSLAKDSLPMWHIYGNNGNGVMLVFDACELLQKYGGRIQPCLYSNSEYDIQVKEKILNPPQTLFWQSLTPTKQLYVSFFQSVMYVALRKDNHYNYEQEVRIYGIGNPFFDSKKEIFYRTGRNMIIPYVKEYLPKTSLKEICLGPLVEYDMSCNVIKEILVKHGYENINITASEIPYRG